jgi:hypothetical protein
VGRPQQVGDIREGRLGKHFQPFGRNLEHGLTLELGGGDVLGAEQPVRGIVIAQRQQFVIFEFNHGSISLSG